MGEAGDVARAQDRGEFIRQSMRQSWGTRARAYAQDAAQNTSKFAEVLLQLVPPRPGERVLDVATGPGVVALRAAARVGPTGSVLATDLTPEWAEVISERAAEVGVRNVEFRVMGAESLDHLPDDMFDVAYCQFGLMFVPNPVQALRETRRVLQPGGRLGVVVWSTADKVLCFSAVGRRLAPYLPQVPPEQQLPTPLALGEPGLIERLVAEAGFREVGAHPRTLDYVIDSPEDVWQERVMRGQPMIRDAVQRLSAEERERLHEAVLREMEQHVRDGKVRLPSEAIYVTAVK